MPLDKKKKAGKKKGRKSTPLMRAISRRIRMVRLARGLSMRGLEELAGIGGGQLSRMESGERAEHLTVRLLAAISQSLQVDPGWLITGIVPDGKWRPPLGTRTVNKATKKGE